ncbi:MAG: hypothetical protein ACR2OZ_06820 [Verrucomicrobiales bacterium]
MKRVVEDGKSEYAFDLAAMAKPRPAVDYFVQAAQALVENKARQAQALGHPKQTHQSLL